MFLRIFLSIIFGLLSLNTALADVHLESGEQQQIMIELFTSEGCSSCPPAEKYLNELYNDPQLWKPYIPLVFHVDYWDYLGWRDVYARREYSERQRHYAKILRARTIYTPEFFVNGKEWRSGFYTRLPDIEMKVVGNLQVNLQGQSLTAVFLPAVSDMNAAQLNVALLGMNQQSHIRAGENEGRNAMHNFVVLSHITVTSNNNKWQTELPVLTQENVTNQPAVVVWVSEQGSPVPIQAVGGYLQK